MQEFFTQYRVAIGFTILASYMVLQAWPQLSAMFGRVWARVPGLPAVGAQPKTSKQAVFAALELLQAEAKCKACKDAVKTYLAHVFDEEHGS